MKKILYLITQSEYGGAQRYVLDLANDLKKSYDVAVAFGEQESNRKLAKILQENNILTFSLSHLKRSISLLNDIIALFEIKKLIKQYQPNIVHLNSSKISILGSLAIFFIRILAAFAFNSQHSHSIRNIRIIYTVHGWVFNEPLPKLIKWFYLRAEKFTARFKDKIICVSEYDRQIALKYKIAPAEKLVTIHNGIAPINFLSKEKALPLLTKERVRGEVIIGSVGNLYKTKGYEYFIKTADILINQHHLLATFIVIGDGNERKNLENLVKKYNLQNKFILAGQIDEAAKLMPALDIYVCSSAKEGFPYSVLEAMSAGLPIISTAVGGLPEMIADNKTGLLAKPADPNDLAEKIKTLQNNKALTQELSQRAKAKALTEFNLEKMLAETKKVYLS